MSTMAVQRKHAHERVSFGVRSGKTLVPVDIVFTQNTLKTDLISIAAEYLGDIGQYGQRSEFTSGNFSAQSTQAVMIQSVWADPHTSPGYECGTTLGILGDSGGMFKVEITKLPPGAYSANITVNAVGRSSNTLSGATIEIIGPDGNDLMNGLGNASSPFNRKSTFDVSLHPDSSGTALVAISEPRMAAEQGGQASEGILIKVNSIVGVPQN